MNRKIKIVSSVLFIVIGILFFCFYNKIIVISFASKIPSVTQLHETRIVKKNCTFWFWLQGSWHHDTKNVVWDPDVVTSTYYLLNIWLTLLYEEGVVFKKSSIQSICFSDQELIISLDRLPFNKDSTIHQKIMMVESLLRTLRESKIPCTHVRILIHHQPATDSHLDFYRPWPLEGYLTQPHDNGTSPLTFNYPLTIMIDPAGDAQHTGRLIDDTFERGLTLQCAEALKKRLEQSLSKTRVILTRIPGETIEALQNANFSNQLHSDIHISIHFYHTHSYPTISLYYYMYDAITDSWQTTHGLHWMPYYHAHKIHHGATKNIINRLYYALQNTFKSRGYHIHQPFGCPLKSLVGVTAPALVAEIGISQKSEWKDLIDPLSESLKLVIEHNS